MEQSCLCISVYKLRWSRKQKKVKQARPWSENWRLGWINSYKTIHLAQSVNIFSLCACGHTVKTEVTVCVCACTAQQYMTCFTVTFSHRCLLFRVHLWCRRCQVKTRCTGLHGADTFTCSQCCTFAPAGLAVTLLADDGAHRIPWSRPELLFSAPGVWLEGRVF